KKRTSSQKDVFILLLYRRNSISVTNY
ncbi:competence protein ComK, partial [Listeria monocytogenes]|nr:competence protein ComK [Listeria monocytogenes]EAG4520756.1 competence protein ComK [Listeria monocytogenes]EAG8225897.1 competence protein ComK [Listeria monocytogenes]